MARSQKRGARSKRHGFTLVEFLVVVLILSILMAVALPLYISMIYDSQKKVCRANMQTISNAVQSARIKNNYTNYASFIGSISTVLEPDLATLPVCPTGGAYTVAAGANTGAYKVSCSFVSSALTHGTFEPGKDSN